MSITIHEPVAETNRKRLFIGGEEVGWVEPMKLFKDSEYYALIRLPLSEDGNNLPVHGWGATPEKAVLMAVERARADRDALIKSVAKLDAALALVN